MKPSLEEAVVSHTIANADDCGPAVHDVALIGDGVLVALGELGMCLFSRDGRTLAAFEAPADALVVSHDEDAVIAVGTRPDGVTLSRLDRGARRARFWGTTAVDAYARRFDGATWYVARGDELLALDASRGGFEVSWRHALEGARATSIAVGPSTLAVVGRRQKLADAECDLWIFGTEGPRLQQHGSWRLWRDDDVWLDEAGRLLARMRWDERTPLWDLYAGRRTLPTHGPEIQGLDHAIPSGDSAQAQLEAVASGRDAWCAGVREGQIVGVRFETQLVRVHAGEWLADRPTRRAVLAVEGAGRFVARVMRSFVLYADDVGRVAVLDARTGELAASIRVTLDSSSPRGMGL